MLTSLELLLIFLALSIKENDTESELYEAIKKGNQKAFKAFFDEHYETLYLFLRNRNISRETAEDLIQKAFLYIWENRNNIKPELSLKSYLFRIAYTRMLNHFNQKKEYLDLNEDLNERSTTPEDAMEFNDLNKAFQEAVESMPKKRRMVFESCFIQDLTYKETAEALSVSVKTVENHMALAFRDLRKTLKIFNEN